MTVSSEKIEEKDGGGLGTCEDRSHIVTGQRIPRSWENQDFGPIDTVTSDFQYPEL